MNIIEHLGPLALATRLKQLSDKLAKDVGHIYRELNIPFEPRWFTLFYLLHARQPLTISELARELGQTHAALVQIANLLEKKGLVSSSKDKNDERRRQVSLSPKGLRLFEQIEPVLSAIEQANKDLLHSSAPDFLDSLSGIEQGLEQKPMYDRIRENLQLVEKGYTIKSYQPLYQEVFYELNRSWTETTFGYIEDEDERVLRQPEKEIIEKGGTIFFALYQKEVVGTLALENAGSRKFRLSKFIVKPEYQRKGIGKALLEKARSFAVSKGAGYLNLISSPTLTGSLNFFTKNGFSFVDLSEEEQTLFKGQAVKMELSLP